MKKLLIVLLALTVVGGFVIAQDAAKPTVTFTGKVETGLQFVPKAGTVKAHDDDSGTASRVDLDVKATLGDFELGYYLRDDLSSDTVPKADGTGGMNIVSVTNYWAGYSFFDKMVTLRAGYTDAATTGTVNKGWGDGINAKGGVQLIVSPIAGLQIGGAFGGIGAASSQVYNMNAAGGLAYAIPAVGDLRLSYQSDAKLLTAGFNYSGTPNLTAQLEMYYINNSDTQEMEFFQDLAYSLGSIKPILVAYEAKAKDYALAFSVAPEVDYTVNSVVTAGVSATYVSNKDGGTWKDLTAADKAISASPFIQFNFNSLASCLKVWYDTGDLKNGTENKLEINFRSFF